jgi:hypothetical protein
MFLLHAVNFSEFYRISQKSMGRSPLNFLLRMNFQTLPTTGRLRQYAVVVLRDSYTRTLDGEDDAALVDFALAISLVPGYFTWRGKV